MREQGKKVGGLSDEVVHYVLRQYFDGVTAEKAGDIAHDLRIGLGASPASVAAPALPVELRGIAEAIKEGTACGKGAWATCTGCYDTEDGHPTQKYAHSDVFGCDLGCGCQECGGIGAVWDDTDYAEMAEFMARDDSAQPAEPVQADECAQDVFERGVSIGLFDIPKETANAICTGITSVTGARVDWHYIAGRVHMKALATPPAADAPDARQGVALSEPVAWIQEERGSKHVVWRESPSKYEVGTKFYTDIKARCTECNGTGTSDGRDGALIPCFACSRASSPRAPDVKALVDRFLGWKLPRDFSPDCGISFTPPVNPEWGPSGTNLLSADQARQMFEYVLASSPRAEAQAVPEGE